MSERTLTAHERMEALILAKMDQDYADHVPAGQDVVKALLLMNAKLLLKLAGEAS